MKINTIGYNLGLKHGMIIGKDPYSAEHEEIFSQIQAMSKEIMEMYNNGIKINDRKVLPSTTTGDTAEGASRDIRSIDKNYLRKCVFSGILSKGN
jgi:hypothetical protein